MKQRHLGTIRSNLDNGWQPSSYSNNQQLKFDDYKFHDGNKATTLDDFYSYSGTLNTFKPRNQNISNKPQTNPLPLGDRDSNLVDKTKVTDNFLPPNPSYNQGFSRNPQEQDVPQPTQLETAQKKHNEIGSWDSLISGGYKMSDSDIKLYNDLVGSRLGYQKTYNKYNPRKLGRTF